MLEMGSTSKQYLTINANHLKIAKIENSSYLTKYSAIPDASKNKRNRNSMLSIESQHSLLLA